MSIAGSLRKVRNHDDWRLLGMRTQRINEMGTYLSVTWRETCIKMHKDRAYQGREEVSAQKFWSIPYNNVICLRLDSTSWTDTHECLRLGVSREPTLNIATHFQRVYRKTLNDSFRLWQCKLVLWDQNSDSDLQREYKQAAVIFQLGNSSHSSLNIQSSRLTIPSSERKHSTFTRFKRSSRRHRIHS